MVTSFLREAKDVDIVPKAIIAPHAGYVYSGPVAGSAYSCLSSVSDTISRVVLLGPAHRVALTGLAAPSVDAFDGPLGRVKIDRTAIQKVLVLPQVRMLDEAHVDEHSLEVHLPFLQETLGEFLLVPLVVGETSPDDVWQVLSFLWGGKETLIVVSSDLSHFYEYEAARRLDNETTRAIERLRPEDLGYDSACGRYAVNGLLRGAREQGLKVTTLDVRNSGDTQGPRNSVVGYGAYAFS
jgi:AmmeMemoRadiSam system protein B